MVPKLELAGGIIINHAAAVLLIHRSTPERTHWEIPGGKVENESGADAVCREIREELGIAVRVAGLLGACTFREDDYDMTYSWFLVDNVDGEPEPQETETHDRCGYFTMRELAAMPDSELSSSLRLFRFEVARGAVSLPATTISPPASSRYPR